MCFFQLGWLPKYLKRQLTQKNVMFLVGVSSFGRFWQDDYPLMTWEATISEFNGLFIGMAIFCNLKSVKPISYPVKGKGVQICFWVPPLTEGFSKINRGFKKKTITIHKKYWLWGMVDVSLCKIYWRVRHQNQKPLAPFVEFWGFWKLNVCFLWILSFHFEYKIKFRACLWLWSTIFTLKLSKCQ